MNLRTPILILLYVSTACYLFVSLWMIIGHHDYSYMRMFILGVVQAVALEVYKLKQPRGKTK